MKELKDCKTADSIVGCYVWLNIMGEEFLCAIVALVCEAPVGSVYQRLAILTRATMESEKSDAIVEEAANKAWDLIHPGEPRPWE